MFRGLIALLLAAVWTLPAPAAVESVTVFPDRASVTRVVSAGVEAGSGELEVSDLPAGLSRDSLRISAKGPEGLKLGAYRLETVRGSERVSARARELENRLQALRDERDAIDDAIRARDMQVSLLQSLAGGAGQGEGRLAIDGWDSALETIGSGADEVLSARRALNLERRGLQEEIERLERELSDLGQQQRDTLRLSLDWESNGSGTAEFTVEYTVSGAAWRPVYEWRLDTEGGELSIEQFAEVRQSSGEDWTDAELNLSLARPASGGRLPEPRPWWIDVEEPPEEGARRRVASDTMEQSREMLAAAPAPEAEWQGAELVGSEYTQAYRVPGRATVAADNQPHRFRLDEHGVDVELSARSVPRRQTAAWLYAEGVFEGEAALPPGPVTLYQDRTLVGQVRFGGVVPGGELASSFGIDDRIRVEHELIEDERATEGMLRKSTQLTRVHRFTVHNGHDRPIDLTVLDSMPVSRDERIEVKLTDNTDAPDERDVDERPGVLAWNRRMEAGGELKLTVGYRLN
ncbi:MAG: DUF4139 domain-containing protein, partial [Wenzhouxiangella sp.]